MSTTDRQPQHPIAPLFVNRWSPRAFASDEIPECDLYSILEAARWAPSAFNAQPWRFVFARRGSASWSKLFDELLPFNQRWAKSAAVLIFAFSKLTSAQPGSDEQTPNRSHAFDTGAACVCLALQANLLGWHAHAMLGFDHEGALRAMSVPSGYRAEAAIAIGRRGDKSLLDDKLAGREFPSDRFPLSVIAAEGAFPL